MKPLSEFADELRHKKSHTYASENAEVYRAFDAGMLHAGALLQAWLREADSLLLSQEANELAIWTEPTDEDGLDCIRVEKVRQKLLGTTRQKDSP